MVKLFLFLLLCFVASLHARITFCDEYQGGPGVGPGRTLVGTRTLNRAVAEIGDAKMTLVVTSPISPLTGSLTVPANVTLEFVGDGLISCGTFTATIQSSTVNWPSRQIFAADCLTTGSVSFVGNYASRAFFPEWWGAKADDVTSSDAAINAAINALPANGGIISFTSGSYQINAPINIERKNVILKGSSDAVDSDVPASRLRAVGYAGPMVQSLDVTGFHGVVIDGLSLQGSASSGGKGIYAVRPLDWTVKNCFLNNFGDSAIEWVGGVAGLIERVNIQNALLVRTGRTDYIGAIDLGGSDYRVRSTNSTTSSLGQGIGSGFLAAMVMRGSTAQILDNIFQTSEVGMVLTANARDALVVGNRADLNQGSGFIIQSKEAHFVSNNSYNNGQAADNTYSGFVVTNQGNTFIGNRISGAGSLLNWQKNGFDDSSSVGGGVSNTIGNVYLANRYWSIRGVLYNITGTDRGSVQAPSGSLTVPSYSTPDDPDSGMWFTPNNSINFSINGQGRHVFSATEYRIADAAGRMLIGTSQDTGWQRAGVGVQNWLPATFAALGTPVNGSEAYCSDCTVTSGSDNTCVGSGTGAKAIRLNSVWRCFAAQN